MNLIYFQKPTFLKKESEVCKVTILSVCVPLPKKLLNQHYYEIQ
jgi:hypothetical protein